MNLLTKQSHGYCLCFNDRSMMKKCITYDKGTPAGFAFAVLTCPL